MGKTFVDLGSSVLIYFFCKFAFGRFIGGLLRTLLLTFTSLDVCVADVLETVESITVDLLLCVCCMMIRMVKAERPGKFGVFSDYGWVGQF